MRDLFAEGSSETSDPRETASWEFGSWLLHLKPFILSEIPLAGISGVTLWAIHFSGTELG